MEVRASTRQRNGHEALGDDDLEVATDLLLEAVEHLLGPVMVVARNTPHVRVQRERTQCPREADQSLVDGLWVSAARVDVMAKRRQSRVYGVQEPEGRQFVRGQLGCPRTASDTAALECFGLGVEHVHEADQNRHEAHASEDLEARGYEPSIVSEVTAAV